MKSSFVFLAICCLLFSSCSTTYHTYVVVEQPDLDYTPTKGFLYEKDSVKFSFSFAGHRMPLNITIDNQSNQAYHLDWNKTAFVVNGFLLSVVNPDSHQDITSLYQDSWDGEMFVRVQVSRSAELPMKFIPPKTKYSFHVRSMVEFEPNPEQLQNIPELKDATMHPTSGVLNPTIYKNLENEYANLRVLMHLQNANQPEKKLPIDQIFFMTQQYKIDASEGLLGTTRYADRGYFIDYDSSANPGGVASALGIFGGLLLFIIALTGEP